MMYQTWYSDLSPKGHNVAWLQGQKVKGQGDSVAQRIQANIAYNLVVGGHIEFVLGS